MAFYHPDTFATVLQPFEITLDHGASLLSESLWDTEQASAAQIRAALVAAVKRGEIKPTRGTLNRYPWPAPEAVFDAHELGKWVETAGLELESNGGWDAYCWRETEIVSALDDRLRALRTLEALKAEAPEEGGKDSELEANPEASPEDAATELRLVEALDENTRLRRELAAAREEPDPRHRKTLLRVIGALLELAKIDDTMPAKTAAHAINARLNSMGQKPMKPDTIAAVITAAQGAANTAEE